MKRQPFLCNGCPCCGRHHCNRHHHLRCHRRLRRRRCCHRPLPSPLSSAITIAVAVDHCCRHLCHVAISHCHCRRPCRWPLPSPSLSAIAVAISVGHHHRRCHQPFLRVVALARQELYSNKLSKECLPFFFLDSGWCTDLSRMTDQVLSGDGHHQHWAVSGEQ
jgi:hypothetical protein